MNVLSLFSSNKDSDREITTKKILSFFYVSANILSQYFIILLR